jgi:sigma-B regulation protein RsbU (phosphoserine phosphatase)
VLLQPGSRIVLYTDGVTEARRHDEQYGDVRLRAVLDRPEGPELAEVILADVLDFQGGTARDDIAVVTITVPADPA